MRSHIADILPVHMLSPIAVTATNTPTATDLKGFNSAQIHLNAGLWTDATHTFNLQESADPSSNFTDVAAADMIGSEPVIDSTADDNAVFVLNYIGNKRYIRLVNTVTGSPSSGMIYGITVLKSNPRTAPVTQATTPT